MKAIVLAAGYATRLGRLAERCPKSLLPVGGRPMLDWIYEKIERASGIDEVHVVTNSRFAADLERWAEGRPDAIVHDDGTRSNDDRLGAIGDIVLTLERAAIDDDVLVIAGDNLFDFELADFVRYWRGKGVASALAVHDVGDRELARRYGIVSLDDEGRVVGFVEKPDDPPSTLAATAAYLYHRRHLPLLRRYLEEGNAPDQPGRLVAWLYPREPVYGFGFEGVFLDIGDRGQLLAADNLLRARQGLPPRRAYSLGPAGG